jgi:hypothetical protein
VTELRDALHIFRTASLDNRRAGFDSTFILPTQSIAQEKCWLHMETNVREIHSSELFLIYLTPVC